MPSSKPNTIFSDFLSELAVPHTTHYSDKRFSQMTFKSLFGLTHLLDEYSIDCLALEFADNSSVAKLPTPFLCQSKRGVFIIVDKIDGNNVEYISESRRETITVEDFIKAINGIVLLASPRKDASEPDYCKHRVTEIATSLRNFGLVAACIFLILYGFIYNRIWTNIGATILTVLTLAGIYISSLLLKKTLKIHSSAAEAVCGVIQKGGCDHVLESDASKIFGLISWSEVGMTYFSVSLLFLLAASSMWGWLAVCNVFCLPYAFWSIWYQKTKAHHWCTLCLTVQALLWLSFFCYLGAGFFKLVSLPLNGLFILGASYVLVLCLLNLVDTYILHHQPADDADTQ